MHPRPSFRRTVCAVCLVAVIALTGCSTPVGVRRLDTKEANRQLTESVLGGETLSAPTLQILNRAGLTEIYQDKPAVAIAALHREGWAIDPSDRFFALAELSFLQALRSRDRSHYLASAVYAYAFLFPRDPAAAPGAFDPRLRTAVDVYNQGIAEGFTDRETNFVMLEAGRYTLPFGELVVRVDPAEYRWGPFRMVDFVAADHLAVRGLHNDYRWPGIGSALVVALKHIKGEEEAAYTMVPSSLKMAATAFLQMDDVGGRDRERPGRGGARPVHHPGEHLGHGGRPRGPPGVPAVDRPGLYLGGVRGLLAGAQGPVLRGSGHIKEISQVQGQRLSHGALPSRPDPAGARARHGLQPGALGAADQRDHQRPGAMEPLPDLDVHLQHRQPRSLLRRDPRQRPAQRRAGAGP